MKAEIRRLRVDAGEEVIIFEFLDHCEHTDLVGYIRIDTFEFHANFKRIWTLCGACRVLKMLKNIELH